MNKNGGSSFIVHRSAFIVVFHPSSFRIHPLIQRGRVNSTLRRHFLP